MWRHAGESAYVGLWWWGERVWGEVRYLVVVQGAAAGGDLATCCGTGLRMTCRRRGNTGSDGGFRGTTVLFGGVF